MSNLSELIPAGSGGKTAEFVASGALPNGQSVILNANGTITAVAGSGSAQDIPAVAMLFTRQQLLMTRRLRSIPIQPTSLLLHINLTKVVLVELLSVL